MRAFLRNLAFLVVLAILLLFIAPDIMRGVFSLFGSLPVLLLVILLAAAAPRSRRRRY